MIPQEGGKTDRCANTIAQCARSALRLVLETVVMVVRLRVLEIGILGVIRLGMDGLG